MGARLDARVRGYRLMVTFPEARSPAKGVGSHLAIAGPALYPYIHKVNFCKK